MHPVATTTVALTIGGLVLTVPSRAEALIFRYTVGGTVSSVASSPPAGQRRYTLHTNVIERHGAPATGAVAAAFGSLSYGIVGGPVNATCNTAGKVCPLSWATPLTVALPFTAMFGNSIIFDNPLVTRTNPLGAVGSNTFAGFGTFIASSGETGSLSFTVNPSDTWSGTLEAFTLLIPGPLPAAGVVAGLGFARRLRHQLRSTLSFCRDDF
jgi:hypothetical protein